MRTITKLLAVAALAALMPLGAQASSLAIIQTTPGPITPGQNVSFDIVLTADAAGLGVIGFDVAGVVGTPISGTSGTALLPEFSPVGVGQNAPNSITYTLATFGTGPANSVSTIATAVFQFGAGVQTVSFENIEAFDNGGNTIFPTTTGATVNVVPEPGTLFLLGTGLSGLLVVGRRRA